MVTPAAELPPRLLDCLSEALGAPTLGPLSPLLEHLTTAYDARGMGLAHLEGTAARLGEHHWAGEPPAAAFPWDDAATRERLLRETTLETPAGSWLLSRLGERRTLLWVLDAKARAWTTGEQSGLRLAGQVLARLLPTDAAAVECRALDERMALASHVTRRLAHDFGNVLTGIMGFTELALPLVPAGSLARQYLDEAWGVARDGADWLDRLRLFCRHAPPSFAPARVGAVLAEEAQRASGGWPAAIRLRTDIPSGLPAVACEEESLREAVGQLLDNAREAITGAGTVELSARALELDDAGCPQLLGAAQPGRFVEITVADSGPGLSADMLRRVFSDLFYSTKPRHRGLGLPIVYGIARRFGGGLRLAPGPEGGTVVRLCLPVADRPAG